MKCCFCGKRISDGVSLVPVDPKGLSDRRWKCLDCDPGVKLHEEVKNIAAAFDNRFKESPFQHKLKIKPKFFKDVKNGNKRYEIRKNDRDFKVGDTIMLQEWDGEYTGDSILVEITYMLENYTGLQKGYCVLGIEKVVI